MAKDTDLGSVIATIIRFEQFPESISSKRDLISYFYSELKGPRGMISVSEAPERVIYSIAPRLYKKANEVFNQIKNIPDVEINAILLLEQTFGRNARKDDFRTRERVCIVLANFQEGHYLNRVYDLLGGKCQK